MTRSLLLAGDATGRLRVASAGRIVMYEVLGVPEAYSDEEAMAIVEAAREAGCIEARVSAGKSVRITWSALIERGIASGVLEERDVT